MSLDAKPPLHRWRDFAHFERRLLTFLAAELETTGQAFEDSTDGAAGILAQLAEDARRRGDPSLQGDITQLVVRLQSVDRRRQELQQIASVIGELLRQQAEMAQTCGLAEEDGAPPDWTEWCRRQEEAVTLAAWRKRLSAALKGEAPAAAEDEDEDVLF
ncbi:hypothetical protein GALL_175930 [mine drainage metagenome]|uniref:Uncharacterized protein n=1 Tax=mine drainage metagenome TaxID=410659 RepID=A0A1J5SF58_9ZZZZ